MKKEKSKSKKIIRDRIERLCVVCGKKTKIILYNDLSYRGGYYFAFGNKKPKDPKNEYWECSKCYKN